MRVNLGRLKRNLTNVGGVGRVSTGGISRTAYSKEYFQAVNKLGKLMRDENLEVTVDRVGNIFGKRDGRHDLPSIMVGSHLDTVKNGGLFDGALGVMAALECISILNERQIVTNHPIEIVGFSAEESSEIGGTFGSRSLVGRHNYEEPGLSEKLNKYKLTIEDLRASLRDTKNIKAFLELHIEQGERLDKEGIPIGIVSHIVGTSRYQITIKGEANHAGTSPMDLRNDALVAASRLILQINEMAKKMGSPFVATVGQLSIEPGALNVIPGKVKLDLEMRDTDQERLESAIGQIRGFTKLMKGYEFRFDQISSKPPVKTSPYISKLIERICKDKGVNHKIMASGAGHDAKVLADFIPTGMIFVPSKEGKSHCPEEFTQWEHIELGTGLLLNTILELDKESNQ